jgi:hypothetical protein
MMHTLILVTMLAPSPFVAHYTYPSQAVCARMLRLSVEGLSSTFDANVVGPAKLAGYETTDRRGWIALRTPAGRIVAQLRCEPQY